MASKKSENQKTDPKAQKEISFEQQQALYVKQARNQAIKTALITCSATIIAVGVASFLILGPKFTDDLKREAATNIASIQEEYQRMERKQAELAQKQAELKAKLNNFIDADSYDQLAQLGTINSEIKTINDRLKSLQETTTGQNILSSSATDLQQLVLGMSGRVDTLEQELEQAKEDNDSLADMLDGITGQELKAAAMMLAVSQLRSSLMQGNSYEKDLETVRQLAGDDPELQAAITKIAPLAETGIMSRESLSREFKGLAGDIVMAKLSGEDVSWQDKAKTRFQNLIKIEKDGLAEGQDTQAIVSRSQTYMDEGDIQAAIAELQKLEGGSAEVAQPWIQQAQARMNAENMGPLLSENILNIIQQAQGGAGGSSPVLFGGQ